MSFLRAFKAMTKMRIRNAVVASTVCLALCQECFAQAQWRKEQCPPITMGPWTQWVNATEITVLRRDGQNLWCGTRGGLVLYDLARKEYKLWTIFQTLPSNHVKALACDEQGTVWIGIARQRFIRSRKHSCESARDRQSKYKRTSVSTMSYVPRSTRSPRI